MATQNPPAEGASPGADGRRRSSLDQGVIDMKEKEEDFTQNLIRNDTLKGKKGPAGGLDLKKASFKKKHQSTLPSGVVQENEGDERPSIDGSSSKASPLKPTPPPAKESLGLGLEALGLAHKEEKYTSKLKKNDTLAKRRLSISKDIDFQKTQSVLEGGPNVELSLGASQQLVEEEPPSQTPCITENLDLAGVCGDRVSDIKEGVNELKSTDAKAMLAEGTCVGASSRKKEELEKAKKLDATINKTGDTAVAATEQK